MPHRSNYGRPPGARISPAQRAAGRRAHRGRGRGQIRRLPAGLPQQAQRTSRGSRARGRGRGQGVGDNAIAGLGRQLTARVQSGKISREQAQRTAGERRIFRKAFGKDWRSDVFGAGQRKLEHRAQTLRKQNPDDPRLEGVGQRIRGRRKAALEKAQETVASNQQANPRGRRRRRARGRSRALLYGGE